MCEPICVRVRKWRDLTSCFVVVDKSLFFCGVIIERNSWTFWGIKTLFCFLACTVNAKVLEFTMSFRDFAW